MDYSMISEFLFFTNLINDYTNSINTSCRVLIFSERSLHTILKDILIYLSFSSFKHILITFKIIFQPDFKKLLQVLQIY